MHGADSMPTFDYRLLKKRWQREAELRAAEAQRRRDAVSKLIPVLEEFGVTHAYLFGSTCRGMAGAHSDIDLYVEPLAAGECWRLLHALEQAAGFPIDLHDPSDDPVFIAKIKAYGELVYDRR